MRIGSLFNGLLRCRQFSLLSPFDFPRDSELGENQLLLGPAFAGDLVSSWRDFCEGKPDAEVGAVGFFLHYIFLQCQTYILH